MDIHDACKIGDLDRVIDLVTHGCDINTINQYALWQPLSCACIFKHVKLVEYLVTHGADIDATDEEGDTDLICVWLEG